MGIYNYINEKLFTFRCVEDGGERWHVQKAKVVNRVEMEPNTEVNYNLWFLKFL